MPDISKGVVRSPIYDYREPITTRYGSTIGAADTAIGRYGLMGWGSSYYDKSFNGYDNQENSRYANQHWLNSLGNFAADLGVKTLSGVPALIGSVTGLAQGAYSAATGGTFMEGFNSNPMLNFAETMSTWGTEYFPQMYEAGFDDRTFLEQLNPLKSGGQLITSNVNTIAFLAQSFGIAGLIGKASLGARLASKFSKAKNFREALKVLDAPDLAKIASNIDDVALNSFLTVNEAAAESVEAHKQAVEKLRQARIDGENELTDEQIESLAQNSQNNVFWSNMATLGFTNYAFGKLVSPLFSPKAVSTRANKWAINKATEGSSFVEGSTKNMSKFERFLFDEGHGTGMATKAFLTQTLTEGPEESLQMSMQNVNDVEEGKKSFLTAFGDGLKDFAYHGFDLSDKDRAKAFGLGSIIGGASSLIMTPRTIKTAKSFREQQERYVAELNKGFTDFDSFSVVSKDPDQKGRVFTKKDEAGAERFFVEDADKVSEISERTYQQYVEQFQPDKDGNFTIKGKMHLDENGAPLKDQAKMADLAASVKYHESLDNLIDIEASKGRPDETKLSLYKKAKMNDLANKAFESGTTDILLDQLEAYKTIPQEKLVQQGFESKEQLDTEIDSLIDYVKRLEANYLSTQNGIVAPNNVAGSPDHLRFRKEASRLGSDIVAIDALISEVNQKLSENQVSNPEIADRLSTIATSFEIDKIEELFPYTTDQFTEPAQTEAARLVEKKKELVRIREKMGEAYTKYLDPKQGFKAWKSDPKKFQPQLAYRSKLFYNDKLTDADLDDYVKGELVYESTKERDKRATSVFYADAINTFIKFAVPEGFSKDVAESLTKLTKDVIDKKVQLYPDEAEKLKGYILQMIQEYQKALEALRDRGEQIGAGRDIEFLEDGDPDMVEEMFGEEGLALQKDYMDLKEIGDALDPIISNFEETKNQIDSLTGMSFDVPSETEMVDNIIDKLLSPFSKVVEISGYNGDEIKDDFTDLARVRQALENVTNLLDKALKPKAEKDSTFEKHVRKADQILKSLKAIEKLTKDNIANKELKEQQENELYASAFEEVLNNFNFDKSGLKPLEAISKTLAAIATPHFINNNVKEPQIILDTLKEKAVSTLSNLTIFSKEVVEKSKIPPTLFEDQILAAINSPTKSFIAIWEEILKIERSLRTPDQNLAPLENFKNTYDLLTFSKSLVDFKGVTPITELQSILDLQLQLTAISQIEAVLESKFSDVDYMSKLIKTITDSKDGVVPSQGQLRVLRELSVFFSAPFTKRNHKMDNVAALKAPAGAGKSLVIAKYFKLLNGLKDGEVFTAAPHELAANNIATSMSSIHGPNTVEDLIEKLSKNQLGIQVRLIVLDEAGAVSIEQMNRLSSALAEYNLRNPDNRTKMIMLYDPNQITGGNLGKASIDLRSYNETSIKDKEYWEGNESTKNLYRTGQKSSVDPTSSVQFVHNITQITPLSTTYRTDVVEISDLQDSFKSDNPIGSVQTAASSNPAVTMDNIHGAFVEKGSNIVEAFTRSQRFNPNRSRVVIVGSQQKKAKYAQDLPGAEVLLPNEAQGITRDEVYVDIEERDNPNFDGAPKVFNQFVYTALSRASKYVHMANAPNPTFSEDKTLLDRTEEIASKRENVKETRLESLKTQLEALKKALGEVEKVEVKEEIAVPVVPPEPQQPKSEEVEEQLEEEAQDEWEGDVGFDSPPPVSSGFHSLRRPNSKVFDQDPMYLPLTEGTELEIVKDISNDQLRFIIIQKTLPEYGEGYRIVAILEESEVPEFVATTGVDPRGLTGHVFRRKSEFGVDGIGADEQFGSIRLFVGGNSADLRYVYQPNVKVKLGDYTDEGGVLQSLPLLERWLNTMYGPNPRDHVQDYDYILENFGEFAKIVSYSSDTQIYTDFAQGRNKKDLDSKKLPKRNIPYLVIENIKLKNGKILAKQFIRLQTDVIDSNDPFMAPVYSFISTLENFESMLGRSNLPGRYKDLRNGLGIQTDNLNTFYPFHFFVTELANAYRAIQKGEKYTIRMATADHLTAMFPDLDPASLPIELLEMANQLDILVHGEHDGSKRNYGGEAQQVIDAIGAQNLVVNTVDGLNVLLRDYRTVAYREKGEAVEAAGFSLLGPLKFQRDKLGRSNNPLIKDRLVTRLSSYLQRLKTRGEGESSRAKFIQGILNSKDQGGHLLPVTSEILRSLFVHSVDAAGKLSLVSDGFGLRRPIKKDVTPKVNRGTLEANRADQVDASYFTSTFDKVTPTRISVTANPAATEAGVPIPMEDPIPDTPIMALKKQLDRGETPTADAETMEDFTRLMDAESFEEAVQKYIDRSKESTTYKFNAKQISGLMRDFFADKPGATLKDLIKSELHSSLTAVGIGWLRNTTAARDYIRATIIARLLPNLSYRQSKVITDLARNYYNVEVEKDLEAFETEMELLTRMASTTMDEIYERLSDLEQTYREVMDELGVGDKVNIPSPEIAVELPLFVRIQSLVMASSVYRADVRAKSTPALQVDGFEEFLRQVIEAADDIDQFTDIVNDPANKEFMDKLGATEDDVYDKAVDKLADIEGERSYQYTENADLGEMLDDQQVSELLDKFFPPKYASFIDRLLGRKTSNPAKRFAMFNVLQNSKGDKVWGLYKDGVMSFLRHSSGKVGEKVVLHELFHKVFWEFLTHGERTHMFSMAQEKWGDLSLEELEEKMAEEFMDYAPRPKPTVFQRVWEFIKRLFGFSRAYQTSLEDFYNGIYQRKYKPTGQQVKVERSMMNILAKYATLDQYFLAKKLLMDAYTTVLDSRRDGELFSMKEAVEEAFNLVKYIHQNPNIAAADEYQALEIKEALDRTFSPRTEQAWRTELFGQATSRVAEELAFLEGRAAQIKAAEEEKRKLEAKYPHLRTIIEKEGTLEEKLSALSEEESIEKSDAEAWEALDDQIKGLEAETFESELRNPRLKLTGSVKQRLLSIRYFKDGKETFGELDRIFSLLLSRIASMPTTSLEGTVNHLYNSFYKYRTKFKAPSIEQATGNYMFGVISRLKDNLDPKSPVRKDIAFYKDASYPDIYVIYSKDGSPAHGVSLSEAKANPSKYGYLNKEEEVKLKDFAVQIANVMPNATQKQVADAYFMYEELDFVRSLLVAVASLHRSNPHVSFKKWEWGKFMTSIYAVKMSGGSTAIQSRIVSKFADYTDTLTGNDLFPTEFLSKVDNAKSGNRDAKLEVFNELFKMLRLPYSKRMLEQADDITLSKAFSSFSGAIEKMQEQFKAANTSETEEEWRKARRGDTLLADESAFITDLAALINGHYGLVDNNSYTRGDGKKAYGYRDESYQSALLSSIVRALEGAASRVFPTFTIESSKFKSNDRFLKDNIFAKGLNQISNFIDHDSLKTKNLSRFAKYLRKESLSDFRERHFTFGFLTRLRQSKGGTYYQYLPIPSNRTSIQAVEVKALDDKGIEKALEEIIRAQKNRPDPSTNPDLAANKTYNAPVEVTYRDKKTGELKKKTVPNYKVWKLAGLEGSVDDMTEKEALEAVKKHIQSKVDEMLPDFLYLQYNKKNKVNISERDLRAASKFFKLGVHIPEKVYSTAEDSAKQEVLNKKNELITKLLPLFYGNFIVNQYSLSQIIYGDETFYKSKEDQTKRIQIVTATGDTLLSDPLYGLPPRSKVMVIKDIKKNIPQNMEGVLKESYRDEYDSTDAEGFMLPEYYEKIASTYGSDALTDVVLKPVYFSIENGIPTAIKYSVKVLTDDLVKQYPHLEKLRTEMRNKKADQAVFASAVKVGMPKSLVEMDLNGNITSPEVSDEAILEINSNMLRFQLNPAKSPESSVSNPSQLTAFMNTNGLNQREMWELHNLNARIIENGRRRLAREFRLTRKGSLTNKTKKKLYERLKQLTEGLAGAGDLHRLLSFKKGNRVLSLDLPLIADRAVSAISSMFSDATVGFRYPGSKLVLQADIGKHKIEGETTPRELQWRTEDGYAEVILPETYRDFITVGDTVVPAYKDGVIGFRIPSTNYHSGIPMKVVGFYKVPKGSKGNVIIAPSLIVYYHGSDYDVDTLFVLRKQKWERENVNLNEIISKYNKDHESHPELNLQKGKSVVGFDSSDGKRVFIGRLPIEDYLQRTVIRLNITLETLAEKLLSKSVTPRQKSEIEREIELINKDFDILTEVVDQASKNTIVALFSTNMRDIKNRKDLLTPISFKRVSSIKATSQKELGKLLESEEFLKELSDAGLIELKCKTA